jgi:O-methyltransferase
LEIADLKNMRIKDVQEMEELYKYFVFPDLPKNFGREIYLSELWGTSVSEGLYIIDSLYEALKVEGDICEFGVAQGCTSKLLAFEIINNDRNLYLFDSFEGLPNPSQEDVLLDDIFNLGDINKYEGTMKCPMDQVIEKLKTINFPLERVHINKGWVEDILVRSKDLPKKVSFAYLDFDFYSPTKVTLEYLSQVMSVRGRIVVDDYNFFSGGAKKAVDEFLQVYKDFTLHHPLSFAGKFVVLHRI